MPRLFIAVAALLALAVESRAAPKVPARNAVQTQSAPVTFVDWSGYRGIRRYAYLPYGPYAPPYAYAPYYNYYNYGAYPPFYYGHYYHRPWYASPYAYSYIHRYPFYAPRYYGYPSYIEPGMLAPPPVAAPQVSSTLPSVAADETGKFYW